MNRLSLQLDRLAVFFSGLCIVHCLSLPVLFAVFPILSVRFSDDTLFHAILLLGILPTSCIALLLGHRHHRSARILTLGMLGMSILVFAVSVGHSQYGSAAETWISIAGSVVLGIAHWLNFRWAQQIISADVQTARG